MKIYHSRQTEIEQLKNLSPSLTFKPSEESISHWQQKAEKKLEELLGLPYKKAEALFEIEEQTDYENFTEIRFTFQSEENEFVPAVLQLPKKPRQAKPPVMICLQGHSTGMHLSLGRPKHDDDKEDLESGDRDFAVQCISQGFAAVAVEQRCFGERGGTPKPDCYVASMSAILSGRTTIGGRVWDIMRLIDVLENEFSSVVNTDEIYCMGNSGGGTATFYAAALEKRIKGAIPSCAFATFHGSIGSMYHCSCNFVPSMAKYFDMAELAGLIAPRPLVIVSGKNDHIFPIETAEHEFERLKEIYYKNSSAPHNCIHVKGEEGHRFYATPAWEAFNKLI